ncbi:MAG: Ig-like domain-containing protein [Clostridia bacterium]|nr:Ig-like domain-containing protein [Clostridia bacterium]
MVKRIKSFISVFLVCVIMLSFTGVSVNAMDISTVREGFSDVIVSKDGKYQYVIKDETGELYLVGSLEKGLTVLNIPEEIDGKTVVGTDRIFVDSPTIIRVNYPDTVKSTFYTGLVIKCSKTWVPPLCTINYNDGIEEFLRSYICFLSIGANVLGSLFSYNRFKLLVLPENLKELTTYSIDAGYAENIIVPENVVLSKRSITINDYDYYYRDIDGYGADPDYLRNPCSVYFTGNALNADPLAFCYTYRYDTEFYGYLPFIGPVKEITIYKKPNAFGFERFHGVIFKDALKKYEKAVYTDYWYGYENAETPWIILSYYDEHPDEIPEGNTIKEYTGEWWKNIKEIQSIELDGFHIIKNNNPEAKGTITELGWSQSNDPSQYFSNEYALNIQPGVTRTLKPTSAPKGVFDNRMFFISLNEDVATVDKDTGKITAIKDGEATIRCIAASGVYSDCIVTVNDLGDSSVEPEEYSIIEPDNPSVEPNEPPTEPDDESIIDKILNSSVVSAIKSGIEIVIYYIEQFFSSVAEWFTGIIAFFSNKPAA